MIEVNGFKLTGRQSLHEFLSLCFNCSAEQKNLVIIPCSHINLNPSPNPNPNPNQRFICHVLTLMD